MKQGRLKIILSFVAIVLGFFMALLDATIVNIALPRMTEAMGASVKTISWVVNGYNLAFAVFIITASRLADQFGRRRLFIAGVVVFTLTSVLSGLAPSAEWLIAFRVLQGLAGAVVVPVTVPLVVELVPAERHGMVMGIWGGIAGLAAASGPALGGVLTDRFGWESIFFVNLPFGVVTVVLALWLLKESVDPTAGKRIDWGGVATLTGGMFPLVLALIQANDWGWTSARVLGLFAFSLVSFVAFVLVERRTAEPMLPLSLLKIRTFNAASLAMLMLGAGTMSAVFLMSFFMNRLMGLSVLDAGLTLTAMPLASVVFSGISGPLSSRRGSRWFVVAGMLMMAFSVWLLSGLGSNATRWEVVWRLLITGAGMGMTMTPVMGAAVRNVPRDKVGMVSGVLQMARSLGTVLGVAVLVTLLNSHISSELTQVKTTVVQEIRGNTVLQPELKNNLADRLEKTEISSESRIPEATELTKALDIQEKAMLEKTPEAGQAKVRAAFEVQRGEAAAVMKHVGTAMADGMARAFGATFLFGALMLLLGIVPAFFSDEGKPAEAPEGVFIAME